MWLAAGGFYGVNEIDCICEDCLSGGKLKELELVTNQAFEGSIEEIEGIIYRTPPLPTWQDKKWPFINGQYCVFEKLASKADFDSKEEFYQSFTTTEKEDTDLQWLWDTLTDKIVTNLQDGNFDVLIYLFTNNGKKYCTSDAS